MMTWTTRIRGRPQAQGQHGRHAPRLNLLGPQVRHLKVGDLVARTGARESEGLKATWGGFAERGLATDYRAMREDGLAEEQWKPFAINQTLPAGTDAAAATMMITWRETHSYISRLALEPGSSLLILGSGGNGFSFAVLARALGVGTVAMVGNPRWADRAQRAGVAAFADYRDPSAIEALRTVAPGGFEGLIDAIGAKGGIESALPLLAERAVIGMYGIESLGERMGVLQRLREGGRRVHGPGEYAEAEAHEAVVALLEAGKLDAGVWFDPVAPAPLEAFADAIAAIDAGHSLKAVIRLSR